MTNQCVTDPTQKRVFASALLCHNYAYNDTALEARHQTPRSRRERNRESARAGRSGCRLSRQRVLRSAGLGTGALRDAPSCTHRRSDRCRCRQQLRRLPADLLQGPGRFRTRGSRRTVAGQARAARTAQDHRRGHGLHRGSTCPGRRPRRTGAGGEDRAALRTGRPSAYRRARAGTQQKKRR